MRILIAEDDPTSRLLLESMLRKWGHEVVTACDGESAWTFLSAEDAPRLVILDWMMPGLDGPQVCQRLRARTGVAQPYIIFLTALDRRVDLIAGFKAGADDYITKPFEREELRARINAGIRITELQTALEARVAELEEALAHVRTLQGILPICMHCRKIRTDQVSWECLESYVQKHSEAQFSHGLCPECLDKYYPKPSREEQEDEDAFL